MNRRTRLRLLLSRRDSFVRTIMMMTALSSGGVARFLASVKQWVKRPQQALLPKHLLSSTFVSFSFRFVIVSPRSRSIEQRSNNCDLRKRQDQPHMKRVVARHEDVNVSFLLDRPQPHATHNARTSVESKEPNEKGDVHPCDTVCLSYRYVLPV
jgi:hypothetical protein